MSDTPDHQSRKFSSSGLLANSVVAFVGAATTVVAATGLIWPSLAAGLAGAAIGYTVTNRIPKDGDP